MSTKRRVKIIKPQAANDQQHQLVTKSGGDSNIWSTAVRLWVSQYRRANAEKLPSFDRLFRDIRDVVSPPAEHAVSQTNNAR